MPLSEYFGKEVSKPVSIKWTIDDLHTRAEEFVTYDVISTGAFHSMKCIEKIGEKRIPTVGHLHVF